MNTELAMANITSRMRDMGYAETDYSTTPRYFVIQGNGHLDLEAYNEIFYLEHEPEDMNIRSDFGLFDLSFSKCNELKYEHRGFVSIHNYSSLPNSVRFIHVVLKHQQKTQP